MSTLNTLMSRLQVAQERLADTAKNESLYTGDPRLHERWKLAMRKHEGTIAKLSQDLQAASNAAASNAKAKAEQRVPAMRNRAAVLRAKADTMILQAEQLEQQVRDLQA